MVLTALLAGAAIVATLIIVNVWTLIGLGAVEVINTSPIGQDIWRPVGPIIGGFFDGVGRTVKEASDKSMPPPTTQASQPSAQTRTASNRIVCPGNEVPGPYSYIDQATGNVMGIERRADCSYTRPWLIEAAPARAASTPHSAASAAPAVTTCLGLNPSTYLGGSWAYVSGNKWSKTGGRQTVNGASDWVVHTPQRPGDPGLPAGQSEATDVATAYNLTCQP